MPADADVVVAGAGPTGFALAIDLGLRGVRTVLLERDPATKPYPKMDRSNARTMELYRRLGIADRVRALGYPAEASMDVFVARTLSDPELVRLRYPTVAEHRARIAACRDSSEPLEPYQLVSQNDLEPLLLEVARETPNVSVLFGHELVGFEQDADGVDVRIRDLDGAAHRTRCRYLAGCDGGRSTVRRELGIALAGQGGLSELRQVSFRSEGLYDAIPIGQGRHYYLTGPENATFVVQGSRRHFTLNAVLPPDADLEAEVRARVGGELGRTIDLEILSCLEWKLHLLLAERYREGRVFLAGDAAHLVIPTGGLGMNTGVGDGLDLSWKLAATLAGWGGPVVLDSYESERRPVGARNVEASGWAAEGMMTWRRACTPEIDDDGPRGDAARAAVAEIAEVEQRRVHEMLGAELGYTYAGSPLIAEEPDNPPEWPIRPYTPHTRPGVRIPHLWLEDGRAVQDVLGRGFTLLDLTGAADVSSLAAAFAGRRAPFEVVSLDDPHARAVYGCGLLLVRPDLHVVWRGDGPPGDPGALAETATGHAIEPYRSLRPTGAEAAVPSGAST